REPRQRALEIEHAGVAVGDRSRVQRAIFPARWFGAGAKDARAAGVIARAVAAEVGGDLVQPRPQPRLRVELRIGAVGAQPSLLEEVERVLAVARHAQEKAHDFALVAA